MVLNEVRSGLLASYSFSHRPCLILYGLVCSTFLECGGTLGYPNYKRCLLTFSACKAGFFHSWILGCNFSLEKDFLL
jgi:hypothetical protein